jgi:acetyl esterase/lipase
LGSIVPFSFAPNARLCGHRPRVLFLRILPWLLLVLALILFPVARLTVAMAKPGTNWTHAVLAGEYGHWLALLPIALGLGAFALRARARVAAWITLATCAGLAALFLKPSWQAWRIARGLPALFDAQLGASETPASHAPFSFVGFLRGSPDPVPVQTLTAPNGLPLDFYRAIRSDNRPAPCVIVVHGGGWENGDRTQLPLLNHWLARRGYAVAAVSYRLAPKHQWPAAGEDVMTALAFLKAQSAELGIDATRLVLLGRSAGGQIAQTVGYTAKDPAIRGVIGFYAPSDLIFGYVNTHENDMINSPALMRRYLGGTPESARANYESASALFHVTKQSPPTLLLHGVLDPLVWYRHSVRLDAKLARLGVPCVFVSLPWATHGFDYTLRGPGGQLSQYAVERFLQSATK